MRRWLWAAWAGLLSSAGGCASLDATSVPVQEAPVVENPAFIPGAHQNYHQLFDNCLHVLIDQGFEIQEANRFDGRIEALPRIAPGLGLWLKPSTPTFRE